MTVSRHRAQHRLQRALSRATIEATSARQLRGAELRPMAAGNMAQAIQCPVSGRIDNRPIWQEIVVNFADPFIMGVTQGQSDSTLTTPHLKTGVELQTDGYVIIDAQVRRWITDDSGFYTGALVRISAWAPTAPKKLSFAAIAHLTFSGYGSPRDDETGG